MSLSDKIRSSRGMAPVVPSVVVKVPAQARAPQVVVARPVKALARRALTPLPPDFEFLSARPPSIMNLIHQVLDIEREKRKFFRPSGFGGCPRSQLFQYEQVPPSNLPQIDNTLQIVLGMGTKIHELLQGYLALHPGVFYAPEVPIWVPELSIKGSCDGILSERVPDTQGRIYRWGVEFKSINTKGFEALKKPKPEHVIQASIYARLSGVYWINIVYFDKNSHSMKEYPVPYNEDTWNEVLDRVTFLQEHVKRKSLPVFDEKTCQSGINFCQHVVHCHGLDNRAISRWWNGTR